MAQKTSRLIHKHGAFGFKKKISVENFSLLAYCKSLMEVF